MTPRSADASRLHSNAEVYVIDAPGPVAGRLHTTVRAPTDHVDVFSGSLILTQPIWSAPQEGHLTLSVDLVRSSSPYDRRSWGYRPVGSELQPPTNDPGALGHRWFRLHDSWVGTGWTLSMGRIAQCIAFPDQLAWTYIDQAGSRHFLYGAGPSEPNPDEQTFVTRDASFIKGVRNLTTGQWTVYFPDGQVGDFAHVVTDPIYGLDGDESAGYYLTTRRDRAGNSITVTYMPAPAHRGAIDRIVDSLGREVIFSVFPPGDPRAGYLRSIDAPAFNGQRAETMIESIATQYQETRDIPEYGGTGDTFRFVPRVTAIERPLGFTTTFTYEGATPPNFEVFVVIHPTGARVEYTSAAWEYVEIEPFGPEAREYSIEGDGIVEVNKFANGDDTDFSPENWSRWKYRRGGAIIPTSPCDWGAGEGGLGSTWGRVDEITPDGNTTRHQFVLRKPTAIINQQAYELAGREIVRRVFEGECVDLDCDGIDTCADREVMRVITAWEKDDVGMDGDMNVRQASDTTWLRDGAGWARSTTSSCDWSGFGSFARETHSATGTIAVDPVTSATLPTPDPITWLLDPWITKRRSQDGERIGISARFDAQGRILAETEAAITESSPDPECPLSVTASLVPPGVTRCLWPTPQCDFSGMLSSTPWILSSAWPSIASASAQAQGQPLAPATGDARTDYTYHASGPGLGRVHLVTRSLVGSSSPASTDEYDWQWGSLKTKLRFGLSPSWFSVDRDIDANTGRVRVARDPAGVATLFLHDRFGRLTARWPSGEAVLAIDYPTPTRVVARTLFADDGASAAYTAYDGFGREIYQERTLPDGSLAVKRSFHDSSDRVVRDCRWQDAATSIPWEPLPEPESCIETSYLRPGVVPGSTISDPLGRVQKITDGDSITSHEYPSAGGVRTVRVGLNGDPLAISSTLIVTDAQGDVVSVHPEQSGGADAAYEWDIHGELTRADVAGLVGGLPATQVRTWIRNGLGQVTAQADPESGLTEFLAFDVNGNLTRYRDATGAAGGWWIDRTYDAADRPLVVRKVSAAGVEPYSDLSYDGGDGECPGAYDLGKLTREIAVLADFGGSYTRCIRYGALGGRPDQTRVELALPGKTTWFFEDHLAYNNRGLIVSQEYPARAVGIPATGETGHQADGGNVHDYAGGWHVGSTFERAAATLSSASVQAWDASAVPLDVLFGNGTLRHVKLDARQRAARISIDHGASRLWDSGSFEYDGLSQIKSIGVAPEVGTHPQAFTHDAHGRLVSADLPGSAVTYGFDAFGNMSSRIGAPWPSPTEGGFTGRVFQAGGVNDNRIHDAGWTHDASGNVTAEPGGRTLAWDGLGRLRQVSGAGGNLLGRYGYDAAGERVLSQEPDGWHFTFRGGGAQSQAEYVWELGGWRLDREYCLGPEGEYAELTHGTPVAPEYYGKDHLGTPRVATNPVGGVVALHLYEPFGLEKPLGSGPDPASHRFTGHERDEPTGLDYMHARYYASEWSGRFLSPDPAPSWEVEDPQTFDRYVYAANGPVRLVDPDGRSPHLALAAGGAVVGGVVSIGVKALQNHMTQQPISSGLGRAFAVGAVATGVGIMAGPVAGRAAAVGLGFTEGAATAVAAGAISGAVDGGANAALDGKSLGDVVESAAASGALGALGGAVAGTAAAGVANRAGLANSADSQAVVSAVGGAVVSEVGAVATEAKKVSDELFKPTSPAGGGAP